MLEAIGKSRKDCPFTLWGAMDVGEEVVYSREKVDFAADRAPLGRLSKHGQYRTLDLREELRRS